MDTDRCTCSPRLCRSLRSDTYDWHSHQHWSSSSDQQTLDENLLVVENQSCLDFLCIQNKPASTECAYYIRCDGNQILFILFLLLSLITWKTLAGEVSEVVLAGSSVLTGILLAWT